MATCIEEHHPNHAHQHGPSCGHTAIRHDGHVDYLHDGHLHHMHEGHVDEHFIGRARVSSGFEACSASDLWHRRRPAAFSAWRPL